MTEKEPIYEREKWAKSEKETPSYLWRDGEFLQVSRDRSEARASGGGQVEARIHGLEQCSETRRR